MLPNNAGLTTCANEGHGCQFLEKAIPWYRSSKAQSGIRIDQKDLKEYLCSAPAVSCLLVIDWAGTL